MKGRSMVGKEEWDDRIMGKVQWKGKRNRVWGRGRRRYKNRDTGTGKG